MELWMPGARRLESTGGSLVDGPPRATWHITYDKVVPTRPSFDAVMKYLQSVRYEPHLGWDPLTGKTVQFMPANQSARALKNARGGVETNRLGKVHIQIEAFFTPGMVVNGVKYTHLTDTPMVNLDKILAWLDQLGIPRVWATPRGSRSVTDWLKKPGHRAHYNVPENDHTDIEGADVKKLLMLDRPKPTPTGDDEMSPEDWTKFNKMLDDKIRLILRGETADGKPTGHANLKDVTDRLERVEAAIGNVDSTTSQTAQQVMDLAAAQAAATPTQPGGM